jgi:hypothetical protein
MDDVADSLLADPLLADPLVVDPLVDRQDPDHLATLSDDELTSHYDRQVAAVRCAQHAMLRAAAEIERRQMWKTDGAASLGDWISMRSGEGTKLARQQATVATALADRTLLAGAFRDGQFGFEHLRHLITLGELTDIDEATLVEYGLTYNTPQLELACRTARRLRRHDAHPAYQRRYLRWWFDDDGVFHLRGRLDTAGGLVVTQALTARAEPRREGEVSPEDETSRTTSAETAAPEAESDTRRVAADKDPEPGNWIPFEARCADALVELCAAQVAESSSERTTVVVHTTATELIGGGKATTWDGVIVGNDTLRRLCCDARIRLSVHDDHGVVGVGRTTRVIPAWLLAELRWRDGGCRFPRCDRTRWLHAHHIQHWADGGPTDLDNLVLLCQHHHRLLHEGEWLLEGSPQRRLTFSRPPGRRYVSAPAIRHVPETTSCHPPGTAHDPPDITTRARDPRELWLTTA